MNKGLIVIRTAIIQVQSVVPVHVSVDLLYMYLNHILSAMTCLL